MSNPFRAFRAASKMTVDEQVEMTTVAIGNIMRAVLADPLGPTKVVADGKVVWINSFLDAMRGCAGVDREMAEYQWALYVKEHAKRFPGESPKKVMDDTHIRSDTTAREIREAFKHDTASSRATRQEVYGPDDYDVDNAVRRAADSLTDEELKPKGETLEEIAAGLPTLLADVDTRH